jgi:aryl-alcohol dehydrogenase-like predicted oxidoreductase
LQVPYSLVERAVERELLPMARALELTVTAWSPLAGGLLTGRYGSGRERPKGTRIADLDGYGESRLTPRNLAIADVLNDVASDRGATASQVAIAWVSAQQGRSLVIPILGARTREQLEETLGALDVQLSDDELERLDLASAIELGFPHDFGGTLAYGDKFELIDDHRALVAPAVTSQQ